ncbi:MAG: response regulator [Leptolyngbyaceae cyanobacterium bins.302]|nr:response regulator [Leptolyngbyaceae cyanobacterium bins.302]
MKTILVIDDDVHVREAIHDLLEANGYRSLTATTGRVGLDLAHQQRPDLILCDVQMPEMDGYEVLTVLRQSPDLQTIPFIFLTAKTERLQVRQGMNLGADDYLPKPCSAKDLLAALRTRLGKQEVLETQSQQKLDSLRRSIATSLPHEFRTPLAGIITAVELLRLVVDEQENAAEVLEVADTIQTFASRLHRLIQNFLLYSKLEVASHDPDYKRSLRGEVVSEPQHAIATIATDIATQANRPADLHLNLQEAKVAISWLNLEKIVTELIGNAFKFSPEQTPVEVVSIAHADRYQIQIVNLGRGMSPEQVANVGGYTQFNRQLYEQQGVGLGIAIARRLIELYDGHFAIDSIPNQVTTVKITLPLAEADGESDLED